MGGEIFGEVAILAARAGVLVLVCEVACQGTMGHMKDEKLSMVKHHTLNIVHHIPYTIPLPKKIFSAANLGRLKNTPARSTRPTMGLG